MRIYSQRELLDMAVEKCDCTYTELAKQLHVSRQAISQYKYGFPLPTRLALELAKKLPEFSPEFIVACCEHSNALRLGREEAAGIWRKMAHLAAKAGKAAA